MSSTTPSPLILRRAKVQDIPEIIRLLCEDDLGAHREVFSTPLLQTYYDAFAAIDRDTNSELVVAEREGLVVGTFQLTFITYLTFQGSKVAQIESVHVSKKLRNQGVGKTMMNWAIEKARQQGCHRVQLTTHKSRQEAHRFYERLGFSPTHEGMKLYL